MKRTRFPMIVVIVLSIFLLSFLVGRATALRDKEKQEKKNEIYNGNIMMQREKHSAPAGADAKKVPKNSEETITEKNNTLQDENVNNTPPEKMLFPSSQAVLNGYSQSAVYSKTMDDWRAHMGIDYSAEVGSEVKSVWDGKVIKVYKDKLWGYTVEILHQGNIYSVYKNLGKDIAVKENENVEKGQVIGKVGESAAVEKREEPHLHFELWTGGATINPESYIY